MAKRNRKQPADVGDQIREQQRPTRRPRRWKRRLGLLLLIAIGAVACAPKIVSQTSLRNTLPTQALPTGWRFACEQALLSWTGNQSLIGVTLTDAQGTPLLTAESMTLPQSLAALALNRSKLGKLTLLRPVAYLATRPDGSNWQDLVTALEKDSTNQTQVNGAHQREGKQLQLDVEIIDGAVRGRDHVTGQEWSLTAANVAAAIGESMQVHGSAQLAMANQSLPGHLRFQWRPTQAGRQQLELLAEQLPLGPLQPWLSHVLPGGELAGTLSADAQMTWTVDPQRGLLMQTSGRLEASQLELTAGALSSDRLRFQHVSVPWQLNLADQLITIEQLALSADWAQAEASGSFTVAELQSLQLDQLPQRKTKVAGKVDLAKLAELLPRTLPLRPGVRIDSGELKFDVAGEPTGRSDGHRVVWVATAALQHVTGSDGGRKIRWEQPIEAAIGWQDSPAGRQVEQLTLTAPFANAQVVTRQQAIQGEFEIDLAQLGQELGQFVELRSLQMRGLGEGTFAVSREANRQFAAEAQVDFTDLQVNSSTNQVWVEPKYQIDLRATGSAQDFMPQSIATGKLQLLGPRDQLELELLEPVDLGTPGQTWRMQLDSHGPLQLWAARLRPWLTAVPKQLEGDAHLRGSVEIADDRVCLSEATGSVVQLRVQSESISVDEPRVEWTGDVRWDSATQRFVTREMQLLGSSLSFRARTVAIALAEVGTPIAQGNVAFRADLERLAAMAGIVGQSTATWPQGTAVGQLQLSSRAEQLQADFDVKIEPLQLVRMAGASGAVYGRPDVLWTEPRLQVSGGVNYLVPSDRVELNQLVVRGKTIELNSSAVVERARTEGQLQASGLLQYDRNELAELVASYLGAGVQCVGDQQVRFQIAGPLFPADATVAAHWSHRYQATAEAAWSSAGLYGLPLGGGRLQGTLRDGQLRFAPLDVAVGQGRLTAAPWASLRPGAEQIYLSRGPLVTNVAISPEVSETMLKYIAPVLAGATRTEGQFSVELDQAEIGLQRPEQARVQGRLAVHKLNVSPGPMIARLATLIGQLEALTKRREFFQAATTSRTKNLLMMEERQIDFQVVEGRVYHRNLEFFIDNVPVRSYGSVGFDQTLALEIEVPIQDKWIDREPALRTLAGQSLKIPIYGTFQKPRIDERALANLSKQLLQGVATQAIGDELNRQFEKLFRGK